MKRFKITLFLVASLLLIVSCDKDFEEINQDPNNPTAVPAHLLMVNAIFVAQNQMYSTFVGGDMGSCWAQQMAKVQYNDEARYQPRPGIIGGIWSTFYSAVIADANSMYKLAEAEGNNNLMAVALTLQAYGYHVLTDMYGDIPFSEALRTEDGILLPKYDSQADVYTGILAMLTQANGLYGSGEIDASSDIMYAGDASKWQKFTNSLKFRALMRISGKVGVAGDLQALVNAGNMFASNDDEAKIIYQSASPNANPLFETIVFGTRGEFKVNSLMIDDNMVPNNDPRLSQYAALNDGGIYRGKPSGFSDVPNATYNYTNVSALGDFLLRPEAPGYFMSFSELNFLMAEAAQKGYISGSASSYYEAGITASFDANEVVDNGYIAANALSSGTALQQIAEQNWLALFPQGVESWTEQRRTGYPVLTPAAEGSISQIPSRYYYPSVESSINATNYNAAVAAQGADNLTTPVWWMN